MENSLATNHHPDTSIGASGLPCVAVVILAAGQSRRAGAFNKLLVPIHGTAMVVHVAHAVCSSRAAKVLAVTGYEHTRVEAALATTTAYTHYNPLHSTGIASSIVAGVSNLVEHDAIIVCLGDMPHVTSHSVNHLIDAMQHNPAKSIFVPVTESKRGNPVLFTQTLFDSLLILQGDEGAKNLILEHAQDVHEVAVDDKGILLDYDTAEELAALK